MEYRGQRFVFDAAGVRLGAGGMAEVYLGNRRDVPNEYVAIKVPLADLEQSQRELFLREAEAAQRVSSPHVVGVVDWGDNSPFIAFEYVQGSTLSKEIRIRQTEAKSWPAAELLLMYKQLVNAMAAINQHVIHRDLKPDNIFLDVGSGLLRVGDFGIAKYVGEVTRTRSFKGWGTLAYMAPETFRWDSVDWRADQYSLGVVFYEMATLRVPFTGTPEELEHQHLYARPPRITVTSPSLPERLATLVARMLAKRREDRYESWEAISGELDAMLRSLPPDQGQVLAEEPLVRQAAQQIEMVRAKELEQRRQQEESQRRDQERRDLLAFWAEDFIGRIRDRVEQINQSLGEKSIAFSELPAGRTSSSRKCSVSFLRATLNVSLELVPLEGPDDMWLWGVIEVRTHHRVWLGNLYLSPTPPPYGTWYEVDMRMNAIVRSEARPEQEDRTGGRYEITGGDRVVIARNWQALAFQRGLQNTMSLVNYSQKVLDFDSALSECMTILVEDAGKELPQPPPQRRRQLEWGPPR